MLSMVPSAEGIVARVSPSLGCRGGVPSMESPLVFLIQGIQVISWGKLVKLPTQRRLFAWVFDPEDAVRGDFVGPLRFNRTCILSLFAIEGICSPEHRLSVLL